MLQGIKRRGISAEQIPATLQKYRFFQQNDMQMLDDERALFDWCCKQTYIALANMMTGAAMIGIDSCPVEGFHYEKMNQILVQNGAFDPDEWGVSVAVTFGYRIREIAAKARRDLDEVAVWL